MTGHFTGERDGVAVRQPVPAPGVRMDSRHEYVEPDQPDLFVRDVPSRLGDHDVVRGEAAFKQEGGTDAMAGVPATLGADAVDRETRQAAGAEPGDHVAR